MNILRKLQNPFALVFEGFVAGAIVFYATMPVEADPQPASAATASPQEISAA